MTDPTLHPNLARIAANYDHILEQLARRAIDQTTARSRISQLEARDDEGVRWAIDPDTGRWMRKTTFGDLDYDSAPPAYGYMTPDAHDLSPQSRTYNPGVRLSLAAVDEAALHGTSLVGATRRLRSDDERPTFLDRLRSSPALKVFAALVVLAVGYLTFTHFSNDDPAPSPANQEQSSAG